MLTIMLTLNLTMSIIFITLKHPLSLGLVLLIQTIMISLITGNLVYNFWFSYILFLILVGGMLILFMYMTSIASNEKFKFNMKSIFIPAIMTTTFILPAYFIEINILNNEMTKWNNFQIINFSLNKYINYPSNMILIFMIMYLFLTLVATVKITNFKHGPLRQMN